MPGEEDGWSISGESVVEDLEDFEPEVGRLVDEVCSYEDLDDDDDRKVAEPAVAVDTGGDGDFDDDLFGGDPRIVPRSGGGRGLSRHIGL